MVTKSRRKAVAVAPSKKEAKFAEGLCLKKLFFIVIIGSVFGSLFFTHTASWDYSDRFLNIGGRTTIPYMMFWGLLGIALVKVVYPVLSNLIERIPVDLGNTLYVVLAVFMILNMLVSWTAIIRQTLRHNHVPPLTPVGEFYDHYYNDEYLRHYFPNMSHPDQKP